MALKRLPNLPELLARKIYKTGQTRGADDDVIYQNRVSRSSTVLIPYVCFNLCAAPQEGESYENGFIVLLSPSEYFGNPNITADLATKGLAIGSNALVFYETRERWDANNPDALGWKVATKRTAPLGGYYVARIPATTAKNKAKAKRIVVGFHKTKPKGAGIRVYEYASRATTAKCRLQLEALFWLCADSEKVAVSNGMTAESVATRKATILAQCKESGLLDTARLTETRTLNALGKTICPLCLEELSGQGFFNRMEQAEGRLVHDLTVTQLNLFHIEELRFGVVNHRPYNVGWGHHHCNVVVKDSGIRKTLEWMRDVLHRNIDEGHFTAENNAS
jgi:hypothetical protein